MPIRIKISDFHNAKWMQEENGYRTQVGTLAYVAPEMRGESGADNKMANRYDTNVDMWSLGIVLHEILTRAHPFSQPGQTRFSENCYQEFLRNDGSAVSLHALDGNTSPYGKALVAHMLARNPGSRPKPSEALNDKWFTTNIQPI